MRDALTIATYAIGTLLVAYLLDAVFASFFFHDVGRMVFPFVFVGGGAMVGAVHLLLSKRKWSRAATIVLPSLLLAGLVLLFWKESRRYRGTGADYGDGVIESYRPQPPW